MTRLPRSLTRVTAFSKLVALFVIVGFLTSAFYAGFLFNQKYGSAVSSVTPTPTVFQQPNDQTSCTTDSDCTFASVNVKNSCCPNLRCLDYSADSTIAVNGTWFENAKTAVCGEHVMCPMIATMCARNIIEGNTHYSAKCISHVCTKVKS